VVNSEFLEANPAVRALLEEMRIPLDDIFAQNARMHDGESSQEDIERHAQEWIENNREAFDRWIETAKAAVS
jgi:glycine betaine/proline transport system substrate-binding protein